MITYKLKEPVENGKEETITELKFTPPKVKHLKQLDNVTGDISKTAKMIEVCANIPPSVVNEIAAKDLAEIAKIVESFF